MVSQKLEPEVLGGVHFVPVVCLVLADLARAILKEHQQGSSDPVCRQLGIGIAVAIGPTSLFLLVALLWVHRSLPVAYDQ